MILLAAALLVTQAPASCPDSVRAVAGEALPWEHRVAELACERWGLADDLARGHARLLARARTEAPALLPRIEPEPPKPRPTGYQLLPDLTADAAIAPTPMAESRFGLEALLAAAATERRAARSFAERAQADSAALEPQVRELERLRRRLSWIESSLSYHRYWQKAGDQSRAYFDRRNELVLKARALHALVRAGTDTAWSGIIRRELVRELAPFAPTAGLAIRREADGQLVLPVEVVTDIEAGPFLAAFEAAVEREWNQAPAMRAAGLRVALTVTRIAPAELYPVGVPARGSAVDEAAHLKRFPAGALVLTTGGRSTHAWVGHYIQLGTAPIGPRVLAHEFGHLLGFSDGYLRGTEGSSADRYGYLFVEWAGILDDLMGAPGSGQVSAAMVAELLEAYSPR